MSTPKKILLIDDDCAFVQSNKDLLEAYGYNIVTAYDGSSGFEMARREHPDLLVLDVMMAHETEGFEVARQIRETPELAGVKILLASGISELQNMSFEAGKACLPVDCVLEKPIDPEMFIVEIERLLEEHTG